MPKNVNVAKKGSNVAGKKKPTASRSRTPNKMTGQSLGGLRGMQGMRPQQGIGERLGFGGGPGLGSRLGYGGPGPGAQQPFGGGTQMGGGYQSPNLGMMGMRAPVGPQGGGPMFGGGQVPQLEGGGGFRPPMASPPMSPMGGGFGGMQRPFNGPSAGIGGGYGNMFGGPSAGGTQTMAQRPMGGFGGMQQGGQWGGGAMAPKPQPQMSQPFTPPAQGPQTPFSPAGNSFRPTY